MAQVRILSSRNQGYGAAINAAVRQASGRVILAMNSDLVPEVGFLPAAYEVAKRMRAAENSSDRIGIVGLRLVNEDGSFQGSVGKFPSLFRFLTGLLRRRDIRKYLTPDRPEGLSGRLGDRGMSVDRSFLFRAIGGLRRAILPLL